MLVLNKNETVDWIKSIMIDHLGSIGIEEIELAKSIYDNVIIPIWYNEGFIIDTDEISDEKGDQ